MQTITITTDKGETIHVKGEITINGKPITPPVKEKQYPWEKSFERVCVGRGAFYIDFDASIEDFATDIVKGEHRSVVPTKSIAVSVLAYTQLKVITTDMNGTDEMLTPKMNCGTVHYPYYDYEANKFYIASVGVACNSPFPVRTEELCQQLIYENTELLEQFYEIKK